MTGGLQAASWFIVAGAIFDFFDGFAARALKVSGALGKELDSLADVVTFGVAPSFILWSIADLQGEIGGFYIYAFLLLPAFSAYRLAKFNIDERQSINFIGMNTPATAMLCLSFPFIMETQADLVYFLFSTNYLFVGFCLLISLLLVSEVPILSLKFTKGGWKPNIGKLVLISVCILSVLLFQWVAVPFLYVFYIMYSILINFANLKNNKSK